MTPRPPARPPTTGGRVLLAMDSFGGRFSAPEACALAASRLRARGLDARAHPLSDGGQGLLACLDAHLPLRSQPVATTDALGARRTASIGWHGGDAYIESAEAIGLHHLRPRRPLDASSAGLAPLLTAAARASTLVVGLGGSATVDGGLGLLRGLGLRGLDRRGRIVDGPPARVLSRIVRLVGDPLALPTGVTLADVTTVVRDCAEAFGPQKGLPTEAVAPLRRGLRSFAAVLCAYAAERDLHLDAALPGGGAAGGLGLALAAVGLPVTRGAEAIARRTGLDEVLAEVDVVVIGEGRLDATSWQGKVASVVLRRARQAGLRVVGLFGSVRDGAGAPLDHLVCTGRVGRPAFLRAVDRLADWIGDHHPAPDPAARR